MPRQRRANRRKISGSSASNGTDNPDDVADKSNTVAKRNETQKDNKINRQKKASIESHLKSETTPKSTSKGRKRKSAGKKHPENEDEFNNMLVPPNISVDASDILRNHRLSEGSRQTSDDKVHGTVKSLKPVRNVRSLGSETAAKATKNSAVHSPSGGIGGRLLKKKLEKRSKDPNLKDSQRLKAIALSFGVDERFSEKCDSYTVINGSQSENGTKRKSLNNEFSVSTASNNKRRKSAFALPDDSEDITSETTKKTVTAKKLPKKKQVTKAKPVRRCKSESSAASSSSIQGKHNSLNISLTEQSPSVTNDYREQENLPDLHSGSHSDEDVADYRCFEAGSSVTSGEFNPSINKHVPRSKATLFCDKCDFFANSIKIMAYHQKTHSRDHKDLGSGMVGHGVNGKTSDVLVQSGKTKRRKRRKARSHLVGFPIKERATNPIRFGRRKASFDPNVDEDATDSLPPPSQDRGKQDNTSANTSCLTPSDSDDEELPDISLNPIEDTPINVINKGDLVWVKCQKAPFWPALVMHVYYYKGRINRLTVVFIGNMGVRNSDPHGTPPWFKKLGISYNNKKVLPFWLRNEELKKEGLTSEWSKSLNDAISTCADYQRKDLEDYEEFFAEDIGIAKERFRKKLEAMGALDEEALQKIDPQTSRVVTSDEEESLDPADEISQSDEEPSAKPMTEAELKRQNWRINQSAKIVQIMTSERCLAYLDKIYSGEIENERHKRYHAADTNKKRQDLAQSHGYGPIVDVHWDDIIVKMTEHIDKKYGRTPLSLSTYLLDVWIPEAVVFAIQRVRQIGKERAEVVFENGIRSTKLEREASRNAIIKNHKNISQEDCERYDAKNKRFMEEYLLKM